jgi:hypothetical protein
MSTQNSTQKLGTTGGSPRRSRTAKALRISRRAAKSRCACRWDGWGRISDDGPGQNNPDRSEGPWGRAMKVARAAVHYGPSPLTQSRVKRNGHECTNDGGKPRNIKGMPGAGLTGVRHGKAPSERLALKPYWGKPAVRNFRGDDGNVGNHRSPVRAIVLPDHIVTDYVSWPNFPPLKKGGEG